MVRGFGEVYCDNPAVSGRLGQPIEDEWQVQGKVTYQRFERGAMFWREDLGRIYVFTGQQSGTYTVFTDTYQDGEPTCSTPAPPAGRFIPQRGFGKVWCNSPGVQQDLGFALSANESDVPMVVQGFVNGLMLWSNTPGGKYVYVLYYSGAVQYTGPFERYVDTFVE